MYPLVHILFYIFEYILFLTDYTSNKICFTKIGNVPLHLHDVPPSLLEFHLELATPLKTGVDLHRKGSSCNSICCLSF